MSEQDIENYRILNNRLQTEKEIKPILNEIKSFFESKPDSEVKVILKNVGISGLIRHFDVLDLGNVDLTCEILKICFAKIGMGDVVKYFIPNVMYLMRHENEFARRFIINEIHKTVTTDEKLLPVQENIDIFVAVSQLVCDFDLGVANKAVLITSNLPFEVYPKILEEMKIALEYGSSSRCNAYEVVINISLRSPELFKMCIEHGYIPRMVGEMDTSDILHHLNILELMSRLGEKPYGINYLLKGGDLEKISADIADLPNKLLCGILKPGYLKFFGNVAHIYPKEIFAKYPIFLNCLFEAIASSDTSILPVALDTLGFIGKSVEGKLCLAAVGSDFICAVEKVGKLIKNSPSEIRVRSALCFCGLIGIEWDKDKVEPVDHRVTLMTREWFRTINKQSGSMETLFQMCKNPFPDIKLAGFHLLEAVCQHHWGEEEVARVAGFIEYLLDRSVDDSKEVKEAKYIIVKRLSRSPAFDANILERLQQYTEEGPFFSNAAFEVALNDAD